MVSLSPRAITVALGLAVTIAIPAEGLRQIAYRDPGPAIWTVCFGSTTNVERDKLYSIEECHGLLTDEMREAINTVDRCVPGLPPNVLGAFADAVYNIGPRIACDVKSSTAARLLKAGDIAAACQQLIRWDQARVAGVMVQLPGLTKRREAERRLCLGQTAEASR